MKETVVVTREWKTFKQLHPRQKLDGGFGLRWFGGSIVNI